MAAKRIIQLDTLRFLAVFLVLGRHMDSSTSLTFAGSISRIWVRFGWIGVDLFFVLSGFLVSGLLFREYIKQHKIDFKRFFTRRGFKIYPPFYALILVTLCVAVRSGQVDYTRTLSEVLFIQNYSRGLWAHTWSLAIEEHFYLLLPISLIIIYRWKGPPSNPFQGLPKIFVCVASLILFFRVLTVYTRGLNDYNVLFPTHLRLDSLLFGVLLSYYYHFKREKIGVFLKRPLLVMLAALIMIAPSFFLIIETSVFMNTVGLSLLYIGFGALLMVSLHWTSIVRYFTSRPGRFLAYLGAHSYSIYLWHLPVKIWGDLILKKVLPSHAKGGIEILSYMAGSIVLGVVMAKVIEFPLLRLRDYLFPSEGRLVVAPP